MIPPIIQMNLDEVACLFWPPEGAAARYLVAHTATALAGFLLLLSIYAAQPQKHRTIEVIFLSDSRIRMARRLERTYNEALGQVGRILDRTWIV